MTLSEHDGAGWRVLSHRNDEAAEVINDVLGMGKEQFAKVAMLPQGEFAAFLTAKDDERRALLEKALRHLEVRRRRGVARRAAS